MKDQQEDHKHVIEDLKLEHTNLPYEYTERHAEELRQLTKKHGLEARKLEMRRAQGAKEVKKLKERLSEMEAEKTAMEKNLGYVAGERDAWFKAFATVQDLSPPQAITSLVPSQSDEHLYRIQEDDDATNEPEDIGTTDTVAANRDTIEKHRATDPISLQSHHPPHPPQCHLLLTATPRNQKRPPLLRPRPPPLRRQTGHRQSRRLTRPLGRRPRQNRHPVPQRNHPRPPNPSR